MAVVATVHGRRKRAPPLEPACRRCAHARVHARAGKRAKGGATASHRAAVEVMVVEAERKERGGGLSPASCCRSGRAATSQLPERRWWKQQGTKKRGGARPRPSAGTGARPRGPRVGRKEKKKKEAPPSRRRGGLAVAGMAPSFSPAPSCGRRDREGDGGEIVLGFGGRPFFGFYIPARK
jgi:hypothetical protein